MARTETCIKRRIGLERKAWPSVTCILIAGGLMCAPISLGKSSWADHTTTTQAKTSGMAAQSKPTASASVRPRVKVGPPNIGPKVANPSAGQTTANILTQLDQQLKAADKEMSAMKVGQSLQTGRTGTLLARPSPNPSSTGTKNVVTRAPSKMPPLQSTPGSTASRAGVGSAVSSASSTLLKPTGPRTIGAETATAQTSTSSSILKAPTPVSDVGLTCAHDPTMRILNVSGSYLPATFTTIEKYDSYTITGCSFGNAEPNAKVYLYKDNYKGKGFPLNFRLLEWHDNWIHLDLDWNLSGLFDQDNLTLVIQRADGQQTSKAGFKFYAAREQLRLRSIPRSSFSLWGLTTTSTSAWKVTYNSPASASDGLGFQGTSAEVQWDEHLAFMKNGFDHADAPSAGRDVYDFSRLQPGFVPTNASLEWQNVDCSSYSGAIVTNGNFNLEWQGAQLWVDWQGQNCQNMNCGGAFQTDCFWSDFNTSYAIDVWVEGPKGIDPWTGMATNQ
ncbi:MAG TPA: hypothetical protein VFW94_10755 [Candidatus Acidoferrales bacterium]|nr:hypothetical protein [Candidatus Acidoferrales bacterium]